MSRALMWVLGGGTIRGMTFGGVGWGLRITLSLDIGVGGGEGKESVSVSGGVAGGVGVERR